MAALRSRDAGTFTWKAAHGAFLITAWLRPHKNDPWLAKALGLPIAQVRVTPNCPSRST
jgi:hypothetical protein